MSDNQKGNQSNEIDLIELFQLIGNGLKSIFLKILQAIIFLIVFGIKRIHFLLLFAIIGGFIGYGISKISKPFYSSELIAQPNGIRSQDMVTYITDLHLQCKTRNFNGLKNSLKIIDSAIYQIKDIQAFHFIDVNRDGIGDFVDYERINNPKDTNSRIVYNRFLLKVEVYNNNIFPLVKEGILNYINGTPYVVKLNDIRKKELDEQIATIEHEINKLDSLQNVDYFNESNSRPFIKHESQLTFLAEKDKRMYYHDKIALVSSKQRYEKELALATEPITIIKDFSELERAENTKSGYLFRYFILLVFLGYTAMLIWYFKDVITSFISKLN